MFNIIIIIIMIIITIITIIISSYSKAICDLPEADFLNRGQLQSFCSHVEIVVYFYSNKPLPLVRFRT